MNRIRKTLVLSLVGMMLVTTGCAGVIAASALSVGAYAWVSGVLSRSYDASLDRTYDAALDALNEMEVTVTSTEKDAFGAKIEARQADDTKITIELEPLTEKATEVKVRVGVFGDRDDSERIHDAIYDELT